eukprot:CAMPEP_0197698664 /NCGR_PEP_ID=MMETSP1338-20131121/119600_1 /TAXON_ID=43686 ORGANISM="Pelagodinium beii, Strain RCC1491" /NCGR_SAMPLE_ID=MMETSP1338 /ASSEMBLY_ACC=CAM_ASM_000754 /LENGTH=83 /DNA_ID=CAMNT_0043282079 /DNA_START=98 /DNA_END=350 /DNA_ORIENTATION=+
MTRDAADGLEGAVPGGDSRDHTSVRMSSSLPSAIGCRMRNSCRTSSGRVSGTGRMATPWSAPDGICVPYEATDAVGEFVTPPR